jgi:hypothetical protein
MNTEQTQQKEPDLKAPLDIAFAHYVKKYGQKAAVQWLSEKVLTLGRMGLD